MYNQTYRMDNQLPKWREASISTPSGQRFFYFQESVEFARYLIRRCPYKDHMVFGRTRAVDAEGDRVYSEMNSADWWWETQDRLPAGGNNCSTDLWIGREPAHRLLQRQESLAHLPDHWEYAYLCTEQIQLPRAHCACLPPDATGIPHPMTEPRGI